MTTRREFAGILAGLAANAIAPGEVIAAPAEPSTLRPVFKWHERGGWTRCRMFELRAGDRFMMQFPSDSDNADWHGRPLIAHSDPRKLPSGEWEIQGQPAE